MENKHKQFAPYDRVLVRIDTGAMWECDFYSHFIKGCNYPHRTLGDRVKDDNILPYEGNEHLVGTTDEPEEEIMLKEGEWVVGISFNRDGAPDLDPLLVIGKFEGPFKMYDDEFFDLSVTRRKYAVKFHEFNPDDMEETRKHILCVRNGKIVKYKGE